MAPLMRNGVSKFLLNMVGDFIIIIKFRGKGRGEGLGIFYIVYEAANSLSMVLMLLVLI